MTRSGIHAYSIRCLKGCNFNWRCDAQAMWQIDCNRLAW